LETSTIRLKNEALSSGFSRVTSRGRQQIRQRAESAVSGAVAADEVLIVDERAAVRPAQAVETKLIRLLQDAFIPVSHLQMRRLLKAR
jgi:hypothetical protein